jgi:monomeric sarcosine oxidase
LASYDLIILGAGGVGSAAAYHAARRGLSVLAIDQFPPAHSLGSSHGKTRIIRLAYFEHPDYVPLLRRAYKLWEELEQAAEQRLYFETGIVEVGPADGVVVPGVLASAAQHNLVVEAWSGTELTRRYPGFRAPDDYQAVFEQRAGVLCVEPCVLAHTCLAERHGAQFVRGESVVSWQAAGESVTVRTEKESYHAARLVVAAGAWSSRMLCDLNLPLVVRRKASFWFPTDGASYRVSSGCPAFYFELPWGHFYGLPALDEQGLKLAEHSGGQEVVDPTGVDREINPDDRARIERFRQEHLPDCRSPHARHSTCLYTLSPDGNFFVDRHPQHPQLALAAGLSGHGFKFTPVLGEALVDLAVDGKSELPIGFLSIDRPSSTCG